VIRRIAQVRVEGDSRSLEIPGSWPISLGTGERLKVSLVFGSASAKVQLQVATGNRQSVVVGQQLAQELHIQTGMRLQFRYDAVSNVMVLGPILGLLTLRTSSAHGQRQPRYRTLIQLAGQRGIFAYLFTLKDIDWVDRTVLGYSLNCGKWVLARYPLPDVVYDRIFNRKFESQRDVISAKQRLQSECHYFNPSYLNKWEVHSHLSERAETKGYLPETRILHSLNDLTYIVARHAEVYLKPTTSCVGKGIMKITKTDGGYLLHHRKGQVVARSFYPTLTQLFSATRRLTRKSTYLVQQGINLATFHGHHYDVRALGQKDGAGNWEFTGMAARVAARGSFVTHVPNGGTRQPLERVVPADRYASVRQQLQGATRTIAKVLEEELGMVFGELSMDLAIDRSGKVWLIEANAKPGRFDEPEIRKVARQRLLDYVCYLAES